MQWSDYYSNGITLMRSGHELIIEGTSVMCNNLKCNYQEEFDSLDDAIEAAEVHEEATKGAAYF